MVDFFVKKNDGKYTGGQKKVNEKPSGKNTGGGKGLPVKIYTGKRPSREKS